MKALILARVSTEEQKEAGNSLPAQIERLKKYCQYKNLEIMEVFSFDESAYKVKRNEFDKIIEIAKTNKEKTAVCFDKVDRFSRNVFDKRVATLYDLAMTDKIELHFVSDNLVINSSISAGQKFQFGMQLGLSKYYSDAISDNVKRAYENKIKAGEWIGKSPIGYINAKDKERNIIPDPEKSPFIIKIFEMYSSGNYSLLEIVEEMKKLGLVGNSGRNKPLTKSMIHVILNNPFYYGVMRIKDKIYSHKYKSLISKDLFSRCQSVLLEYHKKPFVYGAKPYMFRGLITCAECGCMITPETSKGHHYYHCTNYKRVHKKVPYIKEEDLLASIYEFLDSISFEDEQIKEITECLKKTNQDKDQFHQLALSNLHREYDQIDKRISASFNLLADGKVPQDVFDAKLKEWKERQIEIQEEISRYTNADEDFYLTASLVLNLAKKAKDIFDSSEVNEKRRLLNFLLQNLQLNDKKLVFTIKEPFNTMVQYNKCFELLRG